MFDCLMSPPHLVGMEVVGGKFAQVGFEQIEASPNTWYREKLTRNLSFLTADQTWDHNYCIATQDTETLFYQFNTDPLRWMIAFKIDHIGWLLMLRVVACPPHH